MRFVTYHPSLLQHRISRLLLAKLAQRLHLLRSTTTAVWVLNSGNNYAGRDSESQEHSSVVQTTSPHPLAET